MRVIEPQQFKAAHTKKHRPIMPRLIAIFLAVILLSGISLGWFVTRRGFTVQPVTVGVSLAAQSVALAWPDYGQAAIGAVGYGILGTHGEQKATPTASIAKLMLALVVLQLYPLAPGEAGPNLTITPDDVAIYDNYVARNGSVVTVEAGEVMTEYEALQAILLPSANNIADTLAIWATGSLEKYADYSNKLAASLGMANSTFTSASGYDENTVSTAHDLVLLGTAVMQNAVIAEIVAQETARLPIVGMVHNVNYLLGKAGIVGLKTGNTDEAGGCFLFAASQDTGDGKPITVVGAIMGAPFLSKSLDDALPLIKSSYSGFISKTIVHKDQTVAYYTPSWGTKVAAVAGQDLTAVIWQGALTTANVKLDDITMVSNVGQDVGNIRYGNNEVTVTLEGKITPPSSFWRITHVISKLHP